MHNISNMGFGDHILCCSGILESVLWLPPECTLCIFGFGPNSSASSRKVYGSIPTRQISSRSWNKMVLFFESRALQLEGACPDHHICQFRFKFSLCCGNYYDCQGFLSPSESSSCSHVASSNHPGIHHFNLSDIREGFYSTENINIAQV